MGERLSVLMTVFNEASFVDYAIRACLPYIDDLVIVEGAYRETIKIGAPARSGDGTVDIIEGYRNNPKVQIVYANEESDAQQRNAGLETIKILNPDGWLLIIDGDEVYDPATFSLIKASMRTLEKAEKYGAYFHSVTFVNDFGSYCHQEFPRLFRITPECKFVNDNFMAWPDKNLVWTFPHIDRIPNIKFYHFAFCKGVERFEQKRQWWATRFGRPFDYGWRIDKDGMIRDNNHTIYKYEGRIPDIMKSHPLFKR
jgi:glycosyltransferase involved in cell wall biosynthesis